MANSQIQNNKSNKSAGNTARFISFTIVIVLICLACVAIFSPQVQTKEVALSDVIARANDENGNIAKITVKGSELKITLKGQEQPTEVSRKDPSGTLYDQGLENKCADKTGDDLTACEQKYPVI